MVGQCMWVRPSVGVCVSCPLGDIPDRDVPKRRDDVVVHCAVIFFLRTLWSLEFVPFFSKVYISIFRNVAISLSKYIFLKGFNLLRIFNY